MKETLLFVREKAKDCFINDANKALKFVNQVFKEAKRLGFDNIQSWKIAELAFNTPTPEKFSGEIKTLILDNAGNMELAGVKLSSVKMAALIELPDLTGIINLIEQARENEINFGSIPFKQIKNDKNIELSPEWLTSELEKFSVYAGNEKQKNVFFEFNKLVQSINKLITSENKKRDWFSQFEDEGFIIWSGSKYEIDTSPGRLARLFQVFTNTVELSD